MQLDTAQDVPGGEVGVLSPCAAAPVGRQASSWEVVRKGRPPGLRERGDSHATYKMLVLT